MGVWSSTHLKSASWRNLARKNIVSILNVHLQNECCETCSELIAPMSNLVLDYYIALYEDSMYEKEGEFSDHINILIFWFINEMLNTKKNL